MPLLVGGCCYVLPAGGIKPFRIADQLKKKEITVVSMVPSVINYLQKYLSEIQLPHLRYSFFSGDALLFDVAGEWSKCLSNGKIHNFYGPTETTIVCTRFIIGGEKGVERTANNIVPLGKPFPGMEILITDENNKPVNKGELCFSGSQVIAGYLDGKNEEQFFEYKGKRFYKTGDIVSIEGDDLLFLGRKDDQVKINGYRVELGEIKVVLERITRVRAEVIFDKGILIAFVEQKDQSEKGIKEALLKVLPEYMVPHQVIFVQELPLNLNGKVDKKQLLNMQL